MYQFQPARKADPTFFCALLPETAPSPEATSPDLLIKKAHYDQRVEIILKAVANVVSKGGMAQQNSFSLVGIATTLRQVGPCYGGPH